jgi:hypothetical protein
MGASGGRHEPVVTNPARGGKSTDAQARFRRGAHEMAINWSGWATFGKDKPAAKVSVKSYRVGRNADGRLEIFAFGTDRALWQKWQVAPNGGWSTWKALGTPVEDIFATSAFSVGQSLDGRQELFVMGHDDALWHIWQRR